MRRTVKALVATGVLALGLLGSGATPAHAQYFPAGPQPGVWGPYPRPVYRGGWGPYIRRPYPVGYRSGFYPRYPFPGRPYPVWPGRVW